MNVWENTRTLALLSIIAASFIVVTLSQSIGVPFAIMAIAYAIYAQRTEVIPFSTGATRIPKLLVLGGVLIFGWFMIGSLFGQHTFSVLSSSYIENFTIDNAFVKLAVFGIFIPLVETFLFLGIVLKLISRKLQMSENIKRILVPAGVGLSAAAFHVTVRMFSPSALLVDFLFFFLSAILVMYKNELKQAFIAHALVNSIVLAGAIGLIGGILI